MNEQEHELRLLRALLVQVKAERDALRAALNRLLDSDHAMSMQAYDCEDGNLIVDIEDWDKHSAVVRETRKLLTAREAT